MARNFASFSDAFIKGFSFIDAANQRRRDDERLNQRLEEQRMDRLYNRRRQERLDAEAAEDRQTRLDDRAKMLKGEELAAAGATAEELVPYYAFSPAAKARVDEARRRGEIGDAIETAQTIPQAGFSTAFQGGVTPAPTGDPAVDATTPPPEAPVEEDIDSPFAPARTADTALQRLPEESVRRFQPEYAEQGTFGRFFSDVAGNVQQVTRGVGNLLESAPGGLAPTGPRAAGAAFAGDVFVPAEFVDPNSEEYLNASPNERAEMEARNVEIVQSLEKRALNPNRNKLARPVTLQGRVQEGGGLLRDEVQLYTAQVERRYDDFLSGAEGSSFESMARNAPAAAATTYLQDRNTYGELRGEEAMGRLDARMKPVLDTYAGLLAGEAHSFPKDSPDQKKAQARLREVNRARAEIARTGPKPSQQAGIRPSGMPVGNQQLTTDVMNVVQDPNRPRAPYGTVPMGAVNTALTVASRATGKNQLTRAQIDSLVLLRDQNMLPDAALQSVLMTGHWPPGQDPNAIKQMMKVGTDYMALLTEGGSYSIVPLPTKRPDPGSESREFDKETLGIILDGAKTVTPEMQPYQEAALQGFMLDFAPAIRQSMNTASEENKMMIGRIVQQSLFLAEASQNDGWFRGKKDVTAEELFFNQDMRVEYAKHFEQRPVIVPERVFQQDYDAEAIRSELLDSGVLSGQLTNEQIQSMSERDLIYIAHVLFAPVDSFGEE